MRRQLQWFALLIGMVLVVNCGLQLQTIGGATPGQKAAAQDELNGDEYWDERQETVPSPQSDAKPKATEVVSLIKGGIPSTGFAYVYGGKTAYKMQPGTAKEQILTCYMDGSDYSGVTVALGAGNNADLSSYRSGTAGLAFWGKGGKGVKKIYVGILDDDSDGKKVQTKISLSDFGPVDTNWNYYMIPIKKFQTQGRYWDESKKTEVISDVDWSKINEIRFSINKGENPVGKDPVTFYVHDMTVIKEIPGYVDPEAYWAAFHSDAPDVMLHDFTTEKDRTWQTSKDEKSEISVSFVPSTLEEGSGDALSITYKLNDWCDAIYNYRDNNTPAELRDWTKHWGIKFNMYTERPYQPLNVQVQDGTDELFIASTGGERGWTEILIPFKNFYKFPYYQPPEAKENGVFDLKDVVSIDFKPAGEGTSNTFLIDNVRLTNSREVKKAPVPEQVAVTVSGSPEKKITPKINEGIFGINAALWDGDLLLEETVNRVKAVNHHVLRYPGGLRADDDHWKEVLAKKDWMVDTDEFLDFCKKTNTTPMITVNFGTGTPQEAAEWVRYTNIEKKANVKYWEIGNELYGDWHPNHCSAEEYGKRSREFISAMKAVDPSIVVTVVWMLEGDWNKIVFDHTKDIADGVNVHHYPQGTGEENDAGLLSAPQTLDQIIPTVRKQVKDFGDPSKQYEVWLTEWNSVDFKPGPQTLSIVNALFVADYLGVLSEHNIEQASYWDIHNDITEQGGDYGYLSRTGAPDGDNVPRPSYWAFLMASHSLGRGSLLESSTDNDNVTSYYTEDNGKKSLMLINKLPRTKADTKISVPGFEGKATMKQLRDDNGKSGPEVKELKVTKDMQITLPAYSITTITLD